MSLPHAILTALLERPSSGLELTRRFDRSIGFFWSATHQQIYRELGRLETTGLIRALPQAGPVRGQKKEYEVLPMRPRRTGAVDGRRGRPPAGPRPAAAAAARRRRGRHDRARRRAAPPSRPAPGAVGPLRGDRSARLPGGGGGRGRSAPARGAAGRLSGWSPSGCGGWRRPSRACRRRPGEPSAEGSEPRANPS